MRIPSLSTESLARNCVRHPRLTIVLWVIVILTSIGLISVFLGSALTSEMDFSSQPESERASRLLEDRLYGKDKSREIVIIRSETFEVDDQTFRDLASELYGEIMSLGSGIIEGASSYFLNGEESLVSSDRHTTIMPLVMAGSHDDALDNIVRVKEVIHSHADEGFQILITGDASLGDDWMAAAQTDLETAELFGIPIALFILILVFGALVAAFVPLILGIISIVIAIGIVALIGQAHEFSVFITNMIAAMGFALGIDYSLFILSRYREERDKGKAMEEAIMSSSATASRTVLVSGITVVLALLGMLIVPTTLFQSLAVGAVLVVIVAVAATLTLLPALLYLLGDRVNSGRIPFFSRRYSQPADHRGGFWERTARLVMRRPVISLSLAVGIMVIAIVPVSSFNLGASGISSMPDSLESKKGFLILEDDFSFGLVTPARIIIDGDINSDLVQAGIEHLTSRLESDPAFFGHPVITTNQVGDLAELSAPVSGDPNENEAIEAVRKLRDAYIPEAFAGVEAEVLVTGATAINIDYIDLTSESLPIVFIFVLGLSFVLLTLVFHSLVVPIKAILMNLLSVGATYGLVVLVFQKGIGSGVLGFQEIDKFEAWVPVFLFCVLFGLSMDYHVFLLSRIRERFDQTGNNAESVAAGLRSTGSIITGAALIMVAVFSGFAAGDLVMFQQMGFGMAVAVLIDATIVRSVLVPSAMRMLGNWNWYLPRALRWLPQVRLRE